ncbi:MAG: metallophosphoesterase [Candidatus Lokiarchaeota archaeon]|nr:metallophosphoesterase [Candidatus Lokiarchaeota archaeon]
MLKIIHWSDLHYGSRGFIEECLERFITYVNCSKPDAVVCTGDFTHKGTKSEYEEVANFLKKIKVPMLNVIGNHDSINNGIVFFERYIGPRRNILTLNEKKAVIIGVKSTRNNTSEGELGDEQLEWLIQQLIRNERKFKILALHHHLVALPNAGQKRSTLVDAGEVLQVTQEYGVDLVLQGHRHAPHAWQFGETSLLYCGTTTTDKVRAEENPSFNEIVIYKDKMNVNIVDTLSLEKNLLINKEQGKINYMKPRNDLLNHIVGSNIF